MTHLPTGCARLIHPCSRLAIIGDAAEINDAGTLKAGNSIDAGISRIYISVSSV